MDRPPLVCCNLLCFKYYNFRHYTLLRVLHRFHSSSRSCRTALMLIVLHVSLPLVNSLIHPPLPYFHPYFLT